VNQPVTRHHLKSCVAETDIVVMEEENSSLPESIILTGAEEEGDSRWLLLLGQWLHQGGGCYRRADTETSADMLLSYCSDINKAALYQRWCTSGTCGGVRSAVCEANLPPPMSGWQEMTGMGWADIDLKVEPGILAPCNLTVKARDASERQASGGESRAEEIEGEIDKEGNLMDAMLGCYTALEGRWSRGRQVYVRGNFYLLATGWKWKIQESTKENDKRAVEVGSALHFCPAIASSSSSEKSLLAVTCQDCAVHQ